VIFQRGYRAFFSISDRHRRGVRRRADEEYRRFAGGGRQRRQNIIDNEIAVRVQGYAELVGTGSGGSGGRQAEERSEDTLPAIRAADVRRSSTLTDVLGKQGRSVIAPLSTTAVLVCAAAGWCRGIVRAGAERAQSRLGVRSAEHGKRSGLMFTIERRGLGGVEVAAGQRRSILGIVEPETEMESVRRCQAHVRVKTEDLVGNPDCDLKAVGMIV
jgi:hypothetical protein